MRVQEQAELEYVGFWARFGASLIDGILTAIVTLPILLAIYGMEYLDNETLIAGPADFFISYVLPSIVIVLLWSKFAATPGKMAVGAIIVDARTGGKPSTSQYVIRYIGYFVSAIPLLLGYLWAGFDPRKQAWHDKMANTVVVRRKNGAGNPVRFDQAPA
ncbi:MAG: RDD family protein [Janthinobacterium lividum]